MRVRIRAQDVLLAVRPPEGLSARNVLPGVVTDVQLKNDPVAEVRLDVGGAALLSHITRESVHALGIEPGRRVFAIIKAVATGGVDRRDIRTSLVSVQPRYDYRDGKPPVVVGYEFANVVAATIRDLSRVGEVIDGALGAGATSLDGLSFRVDDPGPTERRARLGAMTNARARADVLAEAAGLSIGGVAEIVEGVAFAPPSPMQKADRMMAAADVETPIEAGSNVVSVTVRVTYRVS